MGHYVDADRCAKNGRPVFQASNTLQRSASELTPGARVIDVMLTGDMLSPIPWAYQVFIHWDGMFVLYGAGSLPQGALASPPVADVDRAGEAVATGAMTRHRTELRQRERNVDLRI